MTVFHWLAFSREVYLPPVGIATTAKVLLSLLGLQLTRVAGSETSPCWPPPFHSRGGSLLLMFTLVPKSRIWKEEGGDSFTMGKPGKHFSSQMIKVNIINDEAC